MKTADAVTKYKFTGTVTKADLTFDCLVEFPNSWKTAEMLSHIFEIWPTNNAPLESESPKVGHRN